MEQKSREQNTDLSTFTKAELFDRLTKANADNEALIEKINELNTRIEELTTPPHNDWHSWFYALLMILLNKFDSVDVDREVMLGIQAPRADFIVINEDKSVDLGLKIFSLFDKHNVAEFKSPDDALNMFTLWKGIGYVGFYLNHVKEKGKDIDISEVTLSFFRETKPDALFKELGGHIVDGPAKGIYYIKNWLVDIPIQIIVTRELEGDEYAGFRAISKKPKEEDVVAFMKKHGKESEVSSFVRAYADGVSKVDSDLMEELKGRYPEMSKTLMEIMEPEINERVSTAVSNDRRANLYLYVQNGTMTVDNAAKNAGISTDEFRSGMNNYINSQRQMQTV